MPIRYNKLGEMVKGYSMSPQPRNMIIMMVLGVGIGIYTIVDDMQMELTLSILLEP